MEKINEQRWLKLAGINENEDQQTPEYTENSDLSIEGYEPEDFDLEDTIHYGEDAYLSDWVMMHKHYKEKDREGFQYSADNLLFILKRNPKMRNLFLKFARLVFNSL